MFRRSFFPAADAGIFAPAESGIVANRSRVQVGASKFRPALIVAGEPKNTCVRRLLERRALRHQADAPAVVGDKHQHGVFEDSLLAQLARELADPSSSQASIARLRCSFCRKGSLRPCAIHGGAGIASLSNSRGTVPADRAAGAGSRAPTR